MFFFIILFSSLVFAQEEFDVNESITVTAKRLDYQVINIYVDISEVIAPDGTKGTSMPLNTLVSHYAQMSSILKSKMHRHSAPNLWKGEINVYDWNNIKYLPTYTSCDYVYALNCGVKNKHWTLRTIVSVSDKFSVLTMKLYNEKGRQIAYAHQSIYGMIRWKPQWKLTKIKSQSVLGPSSQEIFEMWPPKLEELPPLITPFHVSQARYGIYDVSKIALKKY